MLLHFIMQDRLQSPLREAASHVGHRRLTHIEGLGQLGGTPPVGGFEQNARAGEGAGIA